MRAVGAKAHVLAPVVGGDRHRGGGVGDDVPVLRGGDGEGEGGLQVGLLEDREHAAGIGHLELRVEVDLVVHRVHEAVQALAGVHVLRVGVDDQGVLRGQVRQGDAHAVGDLGRVQLAFR